MEISSIHNWLTELQNRMLVKTFDITLLVEEELHIEGFSGTMLNGALGHSLKSVCCPEYSKILTEGFNKEWTEKHPKSECRLCKKQDLCPYCFLYEPKIWVKPIKLKSHQVGSESGFRLLPSPFMIEPPIHENCDFSQKQIYPPGSHFQFRIVLFGYANYYLPLLLSAIDNMGNIGLGNRQSNMSIESIKIVHPSDDIIYLPDHQYPFMSPHEIFSRPGFSINDISTVSQSIDSKLDRIMVKFITPFRCDSSRKDNENDLQRILLENDPSRIENDLFRLFCLKLKSRIKEITEAYGNHLTFDLHPSMLREAYEVKSKSELTPIDFTIDSKSQGGFFRFTGFIGDITFTGNAIQYFLPLLQIGSFFHIGSLTSEGFGEFVVKGC